MNDVHKLLPIRRGTFAGLAILIVATVFASKASPFALRTATSLPA
jgi:hypothetical protein